MADFKYTNYFKTKKAARDFLAALKNEGYDIPVDELVTKLGVETKDDVHGRKNEQKLSEKKEGAESVVSDTATTGIIRREDHGLIHEMGTAKALNTHYDGKFKYSQADADKIATRLRDGGLTTYLPGHYKHTAKGGSPYDFTSTDKPGTYISCKSNKGNGEKVAPHSIGQASPEAFCKRTGFPWTDVTTLKADLQNSKIKTA